MKSTVGPWKIESELDNFYYFRVTDEKGRKVASARAGGNSDNDSERLCANARLIATAPELLESLENIYAIAVQHIASDNWELTEALASIAKAKTPAIAGGENFASEIESNDEDCAQAIGSQKEFEVWAKQHVFSVKKDKSVISEGAPIYANPMTQGAYMAWCASRDGS